MIARSARECLLYLQLHPCECGARSPATSKGIASKDGGLVARYAGTCTSCGRESSFEFVLAPETPPIDAYGVGAKPSEIICPGEFAQHSDDLAARWPGNPDAIPEAKRPAAREDLAWAIRDLEEVAKFMQGGAVPEGAFTSAKGRELFSKEPGRFRALRLNARLQAYRGLLAQLADPIGN